ncbi:Uncharacterised protein [Legionella pneumophila]|nr:Uncharacterised protein [Legionella pneumophila]
MFSKTIIASSTTKPIANTIASKVIKLIEKPNNLRKSKDPNNEIGMVIRGMMVALILRKKRKTMIKTKKMASPIADLMFLMEALIKSD